MLRYKAGYKFIGEGVHAQVLDFPAAISCGDNLDDAQRMLASALVDVAEALVALGEPLPQPDPDPSVSDPAMNIEEPIHLRLTAGSEVSRRPTGAAAH